MITNDDNEKITYLCPVCGKEKKAIYAYHNKKSMCFDCLRTTDAVFSRRISESETEWRNWKLMQKVREKQRGSNT